MPEFMKWLKLNHRILDTELAIQHGDRMGYRQSEVFEMMWGAWQARGAADLAILKRDHSTTGAHERIAELDRP